MLINIENLDVEERKEGETSDDSDSEWIQQHLITTERMAMEDIDDDAAFGHEEEVEWIKKHRVLPIATDKHSSIDSKTSNPLISVLDAGYSSVAINRDPMLDRTLWMLEHLVTKPHTPLIEINLSTQQATENRPHWKVANNPMAQKLTRQREKGQLEISLREPPTRTSAMEKFSTSPQTHLANDKLFNKYKNIDKQMLIITRAPAALLTKLSPPTTRHLQTSKVHVTNSSTVTVANTAGNSMRQSQRIFSSTNNIHSTQNVSTESTTTRKRPNVTVEGHKVIEDKINNIYSEWVDETDKVDHHAPEHEDTMTEVLEKILNEKASHHKQLFDYADDYGDSYLAEDTPDLSDINIIQQLVNLKHELEDTKGKLHTVDVFGKQKVNSANKNDVTLESEMGDISDEMSANEGHIADLEAEVKQAEHAQSYDTSRDRAINKEISQLSDSLQQVEQQVEAIAGSEKNSASNLKQSADRTEQVVAAELDKIEKTLQTNSEQIHQLQQEVINKAHEQSEHDDFNDLEQEKLQLDKNLEGHEKVVSNDIKSIEKVASDVEKGIASLTKHVDTMEASQKASQEKLLGVLSELANGVVNNKKEQAKTMEVLANAQVGLNKKIQDSKKREHKPLMLVIPEQATNNPSDVIKLHDAKHVIANIDKEAKSLLTKEESLAGEALEQDEELRSLRQQTDETVKSLLKDSQLLDYQSADEQKHLAKEANDKKIIQGLLHDRKKGWSDWSSWSNCFGFGCKSVGKSQRYRVCESMRGQCGGDAWQSKSCRRTCQPAQLASGSEWSAWSSWSECSRTCGGGTAGRERVCASDVCEGSAEESRPCSLRPCPAYPVATYAIGHIAPTAAMDNMNHHGAVVYGEQHALDRGVMITCGHNPCLNGGVCVGGGENEHVSHFMHFHCRCVHPYSGLLCDSTCQATNEANGIAIGILAGVLAMVLLVVGVYACITFRQRVERWRHGYDPYSRRGRCWEKLFGSRYSSAGSSYYTGSKTFSRCSAVTSSCGGLSVDEHMHGPAALDFSHDKRSRDPLANSEYELEGTLSRSGNTSRRISSDTKVSKQRGTTTSYEDSSESESETEDDSSEVSLEYDTSTNENDNAKDHTLTQQSLAKNVTNNQSALPNSTSTNKKLKKKVKQSEMKEPPKQITHLNEIYRKGHGSKEPKVEKIKKKRKRADNSNQTVQANDKAVKPDKPDVAIECDQDDLEKNHPEPTNFQERVEMVPTFRFRDPQLAERMHAIRQTIPKSHDQGNQGDALAKYPLVQDFMSKWYARPSDATTTPSKGSRPSPTDSQRGDMLPTDASTWTAVAGNPVHSVWSQMTPPQQQPLMYEPTLSHSLASAVHSVKSFNSNVDRSPVKESRIHDDDMV